MMTIKGKNLDTIRRDFQQNIDSLQSDEPSDTYAFICGQVIAQPKTEFSEEVIHWVPIWTELFQLAQKIIYNIADYQLGNDSRRGQIAFDVQENHKLLIIEANADDFSVHLGSPHTQMSLLASSSPVHLLIELLSQMKQMENGLDLLYLYNQRTFNSVKQLFSLLDQHFDQLTIKGEKSIRSVSFSRDEIVSVRKKLRYRISDFEDTPLVIRGKIIGVHHPKQQIYVETNTDQRTFYIVDPHFRQSQLLTNTEYRIFGHKLIYRLSGGQNILKYSINRLSDLQVIKPV